MALAQTSDEWRMRVFNLYVAQIAVDICEIDLPKAIHDRFDKATDVAEKRSGASTEELNVSFKTMKTGASQNPKGFCSQMLPAAKKTIAEFED